MSLWKNLGADDDNEEEEEDDDDDEEDDSPPAPGGRRHVRGASRSWRLVAYRVQRPLVVSLRELGFSAAAVELVGRRAGRLPARDVRLHLGFTGRQQQVRMVEETVDTPGGNRL